MIYASLIAIRLRRILKVTISNYGSGDMNTDPSRKQQSSDPWWARHWLLAGIFGAGALVALVASAWLFTATEGSSWLDWGSNVLANAGVALFLAVPITGLGLAFNSRLNEAAGTAKSAEDKAEAAQQRATVAEQKVEDATQSFSDALAELKGERAQRRSVNDAVYRSAVDDPSVSALCEALLTAEGEGIVAPEGIRIPVPVTIEDPESRLYIRFSVEDDYLLAYLGDSSGNDSLISDFRRDDEIKTLLGAIGEALEATGSVLIKDGEELPAELVVTRLARFFLEVADSRVNSAAGKLRYFAGITQVDDIALPHRQGETETWYFTNKYAVPVARPEQSFLPGSVSIPMRVDQAREWHKIKEEAGVFGAGIAKEIAEDMNMGQARRKSL